MNGRYVYCIVDASISTSLGKVGIDESEVYTIPHLDISAIVHKCAAKAYDSNDEKTVINYVQKHNAVVTLASDKFNSMVPLRFNTIIKENGEESDDEVKKWLAKQYPDLRKKLDRFQGKEEYGIQVLLNAPDKVSVVTPKISELENKIESAKSPGQAYMHKQMLKSAARKEVEHVADEIAKQVHALAKEHCTDVRLEKTKKNMLLNLSCLVKKENVGQLMEKLGKIDGAGIASVRITGPWAPYSFVGEESCFELPATSSGEGQGSG